MRNVQFNNYSFHMTGWVVLSTNLILMINFGSKTNLAMVLMSN